MHQILFLCKFCKLNHILFLGVNMKLSEMSKKKNSEKISSSKQQNINKAYDDLKDRSSDELFSMLTKEIQNQKLNGTFDYDALRASLEKIKTYLPTQTYENMIRIIDSLK